jgi:large subunit ribosomal protein L10
VSESRRSSDHPLARRRAGLSFAAVHPTAIFVAVDCEKKTEMNKEQKAAVVEELSKELSDAEAIFAIDYRGISVPQAAELREGLRDADARFRVVKNRLTVRAADAAGTAEIKDYLSGPTALALVGGDPALAAKTIARLGSEWELLDYKGGMMEGAALDPDTFQAIAKLPGREALNAQAAGLIASPLTGLVRGLGSMVQGLAIQLSQIAEKGLVTGEAPAEEAPAEEEEAPAEEAPAEGVPAEEDPPAAEETQPDPEPSESPEETSEEEGPEGEEAGEESQVEETTEGDAEIGEAQEEAQDETSEDSDDAKEDGE